MFSSLPLLLSLVTLVTVTRGSRSWLLTADSLTLLTSHGAYPRDVVQISLCWFLFLFFIKTVKFCCIKRLGCLFCGRGLSCDATGSAQGGQNCGS